MVNLTKTPAERYVETSGDGPRFFRSIIASRQRIAEGLKNLLASGLRDRDSGSQEEISVRQMIWEADSAYPLVNQLSENESNQDRLTEILRQTRERLLKFESLRKC